MEYMSSQDTVQSKADNDIESLTIPDPNLGVNADMEKTFLEKEVIFLKLFYFYFINHF